MSDYETMQRRRSFIVGLFVMLAVVAFFWLIFKFGDLPIFVSEIRSYEVRIQLPSAPGVQKDTPVRFCGYQIGRVTDVNPPQVMRDLKTREWYHQTLVIASIDNHFKNIPDVVEVRLMTRGLGSSYIEFIAPPVDVRGGKVLVEGSLLQGSTGVSSEFFPEQTQRKLDDLITKITVLANSINDVVGDDENKKNFKMTLKNISSASAEANDLILQLKDAVLAGKTTLQNADERMELITTSLVNTSDKLGEVMTHLELITSKINNGQGTAGKLINDGRLYEQLLEDSRQVELFLKEIKTFIAESKEKGLPLKLK
ncbi:MAG: MCE family protein [Sedimentisphaerales bacterium]|nr:MCE family protein [Sedimentisphaerales bacterium]